MVENLCRRKLVVEPEWTGFRPIYLRTKVHNRPSVDGVDSTDIGCSDHFLVWMELGRTAKNLKKETRVYLERFEEDEVKLRYQNALKAEVHGFSESIKSKLEGGMKGHDLVNEVLWSGRVL